MFPIPAHTNEMEVFEAGLGALGEAYSGLFQLVCYDAGARSVHNAKLVREQLPLSVPDLGDPIRSAAQLLDWDRAGRAGYTHQGYPRRANDCDFWNSALVSPSVRRRLLFTLLGSISWGVICAPARGQVNVEVLRADLKESGFGAKLDASLESYLGNTQGSTLGAEALVGLAADRHLAYLSARGDHSRLGHETQVSQAFLHARYNLRLWSWVWGEVFGQIESDRFRRIALRELLGIGPRFELLDTDTVAVYYGAAYMLEHTRLRPGTERVEGRPDIVHRFSNYAAIAANFDGERMVLSQTVYYQPRFDDFGDWRLLTSTGLDFDLSGPFTAGISATFRFEDPTPSSVQRADFTLHNTFGVEL